MSLRRRDVLRTATALSFAAIAGCSGVLDSSEPPDYADAIPRDGADGEDGVFFVHLDAEWLRAFDGEEELPYAAELSDSVEVDLDPDTPPVDADPLLAYPTAGLAVGALSLGFGLLPYGFGDVVLSGLDGTVAPDDAGDDQPPEAGTEVDATVRIDSMLLVDGVGVFRGEFDARTIVSAAGDFEPAGERDGFDVYEGTGDGLVDTEGLAFAVRDGVLVTLLDDGADLGRVLGSIAGGADRLGGIDDGGWALSEAGHGHVTLGVWGVEPAQAAAGDRDPEFVDTGAVLGDAVGLVSSLTLGPEEGVGTIAAVFPPDETPQRAAIENRIGTSASSREIAIDDTRVSVTGKWRVPDEGTEP